MKALVIIALLASAVVAEAYPRPTIDDVPPQSLLNDKSQAEILADLQREWDSSVYAMWANEKMMANGRKNVSYSYTCGRQYIAGMPTLKDVPARSLLEGKSDTEVLCELIEQWENSGAGFAAKAAHTKAAQAAAKAAGYVAPKTIYFQEEGLSIGQESNRTFQAIKVTNGKALIDTNLLEGVTVHQNLGSEKCVRNVNWTLSAGGYIRTSGGCKAIFKATYTKN